MHYNSLNIRTSYYPFGMPMPGRQYISALASKRFGYQGQFAEKDEETGWNNFYFRDYDAEVGRFLTFDPYNQYHSPYVGMGNNPVSMIDRDGGWVQLGNTAVNIGTGFGGSLSGFGGAINAGVNALNGGEVNYGQITSKPGISANLAQDALNYHSVERFFDEQKNSGMLDASVGFVGGLAEVIVGVFGEAPSLGVSNFMVYDGVVRMGLNVHRFIEYYNGNINLGNNLPSNVLGAFGKVVDLSQGGSFGEKGKFQTDLGITNDIASIIVTGGSGSGWAGVMQSDKLIRGASLVGLTSHYQSLYNYKK